MTSSIHAQFMHAHKLLFTYKQTPNVLHAKVQMNSKDAKMQNYNENKDYMSTKRRIYYV